MFTWAITRAGYDLNTFTKKFPMIKLWLEGEKTPTFKQLEGFSKKVHLPFGYLFLKEPPLETLPIPFFRSQSNETSKISLNVYDTILLLQMRQDWLSNYLQDNNFKPLSFVGKSNKCENIKEIVNDIRETLKLSNNWASLFRTWQEAQDHLIQQIEDAGIISVFNSIVENNTHRPISVDECRGFVLVDTYAPFMFINSADWKSAQMFTILHELAHIWTGHSAGFDFRRLQPANDPIEIKCDKIAAEFLVPEDSFNDIWNHNRDFTYAAKHFKVSKIVIARRALDTGKISKAEFFTFYDEYSKNEFLVKEKQSQGGNFYETSKKRISITFANHVKQALNSGQLLFRDAYKLTGLKGDTLDHFFTSYI